MTRASAWFAGLTPRERWLVSGALAIAAALLAVWAALRLADAYNIARDRHATVVEQSARLRAALDAIDHAPRSAALAQALDRTISDSAARAGVVLQSVQPRGADEAVVMIAGARPASVLGWLDTLPHVGITVTQATMTPAPDGSLAVSATLRSLAHR